MKTQISVFALVGIFLIPESFARYGVDSVWHDPYRHRQVKYQFTDESTLSFFNKSAPLAIPEEVSRQSPRFTRSDATRYLPINPDKLHFESGGIVRYSKVTPKLSVEDIPWAYESIQPTETSDVYNDLQEDSVEESAAPLVASAIPALDDNQLEEQCLAACEAFEDLKNNRLTRYFTIFSNSDSQDPIFGWRFNPLLDVMLPQFAMVSKQNAGHLPPYKPLPIEFMGEASDIPSSIVQNYDDLDSPDQGDSEEIPAALTSEVCPPYSQQDIPTDEINELEEVPLLGADEIIDEPSSVASTIGKWISTTAIAIHKYLFF